MYTLQRRHWLVVAVCLLFGLTVAACGGTPTPTPVAPTATPAPPTATPVPPTATSVPPTWTATATRVPPTATLPPPSATATRVAPSPTAVTAAAMGNASPADRELVAAAFTNVAKASSFAMRLKLEGAGAAGVTGDIVMEVALLPVRSVRMTMPGPVEMIVIGQDAYMKFGAAPWQKSAMAPAQLQQLEESLGFASAVKPEDLARIEVNKVTSEKVEGVDCDVFDIMLPGAQPQLTRVWVSRADRKIVRQILDVEGSKATITFYGWNTIKVEAPAM